MRVNGILSFLSFVTFVEIVPKTNGTSAPQKIKKSDQTEHQLQEAISLRIVLRFYSLFRTNDFKVSVIVTRVSS